MLEDHQRVGKKLVPPAAGFDWTKVNFIQQILPEIVWMGFVVDSLGVTEGLKLCTAFSTACFRECSQKPVPEFAFLSLHRTLTSDDQRRVVTWLRDAGLLDGLKCALRPFVRCYPQANPIRYLFEAEEVGDPTKDDIAAARRAVSPRMDRWSIEATVIQGAVMRSEIASGRLQFGPKVSQPNLDLIQSDPKSDEGLRAASHARTFTSSSWGFYQERIGSAWAGYFWQRGLELDPPTPHLSVPEAVSSPNQPFVEFGSGFEALATRVVKDLSEKLISHALPEEVHSVLGGLLARQATLAIAVASNPSVWNWDIGPLYLRAMTDCHITAAWILCSPVERSQLYIEHGLGQEKLWMAHYEQLEEQEKDTQDKANYRDMLEASKAWVESQSFLFFVTVNLGGWAGKSTREMAKEAGCLDLYNFSYVPFSFSAHNTWNHVGKFNSMPTESALAKRIRMPMLGIAMLDPSIMVNAAKYLDKTANAISAKCGIPLSEPQPLDWTHGRMPALLAALEKQSDG